MDSVTFSYLFLVPFYGWLSRASFCHGRLWKNPQSMYLARNASRLCAHLGRSPCRYEEEAATNEYHVFSQRFEPYQRFGMVFRSEEPVNPRILRALQPNRTTAAYAVLSEHPVAPGGPRFLPPGDWVGIYRRGDRRLVVICCQGATRELPLVGTWGDLARSWRPPESHHADIARALGVETGDLFALCPLTSVRLSLDHQRVCVTSGCVSRLPEFSPVPPPALVVPSFTKGRVWIVPEVPSSQELGILSAVSKDSYYVPLDYGKSIFLPERADEEYYQEDDDAWILQRMIVNSHVASDFDLLSPIEEQAKIFAERK